MKSIIQSEQLTWQDKWLAIRAGLLIPVVEIWMRKSSFQKCQQGLQTVAKKFPFRMKQRYSADDAHHVARLIELGNRRYSIYPADCLTRSLVLQYVLIRQGIESELCLGVRTITGQFEAHAWVEVDNMPLNETESVQDIYSAFDWTAEKMTD